MTSTRSRCCFTSRALDDIVVKRLGLIAPPTDLAEWRQVVQAKAHPDAVVDIAMVGKYVQMRDSYISLNEALTHAGIRTRTRVNVHYIESTDIELRGTACLDGMDAVLVPGGFGERGIEGKIQAVRYAREKRIPYLGICLGMQVAVIEYARHKLGLEGGAQHGIRPRHPASGYRDDHRVAGPGARRAAAQ